MFPASHGVGSVELGKPFQRNVLAVYTGMSYVASAKVLRDVGKRDVGNGIGGNFYGKSNFLVRNSDFFFYNSPQRGGFPRNVFKMFAVIVWT